MTTETLKENVDLFIRKVSSNEAVTENYISEFFSNNKVSSSENREYFSEVMTAIASKKNLELNAHFVTYLSTLTLKQLSDFIFNPDFKPSILFYPAKAGNADLFQKFLRLMTAEQINAIDISESPISLLLQNCSRTEEKYVEKSCYRASYVFTTLHSNKSNLMKSYSTQSEKIDTFYSKRHPVHDFTEDSKTIKGELSERSFMHLARMSSREYNNFLDKFAIEEKLLTTELEREARLQV